MSNVSAETDAAILERIAAAVPSPHAEALCAVAQRLRFSASKVPVQVPLLYLNPKILDAAGKVAVTGALTWSETACAGWTLPIYTAPVVEASAQVTSAEDREVYKNMADRYFHDTQAVRPAGVVEREALLALFRFMQLTFVPMTPQQEEIKKQLDVTAAALSQPRQRS